MTRNTATAAAATILGAAASNAAAITGFGITDSGLNGSQLVTWNPGDAAVTSLPQGFYDGLDLEASDINAGGQWWVIGGGDTIAPDRLYLANTADGELFTIADMNFSEGSEVVSASFNPNDGTLWMYRQSSGFYSIFLANPTNPILQFARPGNVEAMAWSPAGDQLFYFNQRDLFVWDPINGETLLEANLTTAPIESLEFDTAGNLIAGIETSSSSFDLLQIDPLNPTAFTVIDSFTAPSGDIESITFIPAPGAAGLLAAAGIAATRRRR